MFTLLTATSVFHLERILQKLVDFSLQAGKHLLLGLVVLVVGRYLIKLANRLFARTLERRKVDPSVQSFLRSLVNILLLVLLAVSVVGTLGVNTTSFAALLASAGVAVGMALSGNLQNLAGGLIILLFKPYRVGDWVEAQGTSGTVREIQIFHTIIVRADNTVAYVPNGAMSSGLITNYSRQAERRLDFVVGVDYGEDISRVEAAVRRVVEADERVLPDPAPFVAVDNLDASSVNVLVRLWVKTEDYWALHYALRRSIYDAFNREHINFPYPQQTIHLDKG